MIVESSSDREMSRAASHGSAVDSPCDEGQASEPPPCQVSSSVEASARYASFLAAVADGTNAGTEVDRLVAPENLESQFENDFENHLQRRNKLKRGMFSTLGAGIGVAGVGIGGLIGFSTLFLPGLAAGAIVGGAGGYQLAKRRGQSELERHTRRPSETTSEQLLEVPQLPTLRRLKYLVKWGHWQLLDYAGAPAEWRSAVLDEVVRAFSPWVEKIKLHPDCTDAENSTEMREVLQYMMHLYKFLQRRLVREALFESAATVNAAFSESAADSTCLDRCRTIFPVILVTIMEVDRLRPQFREQLLRDTSSRRRHVFSRRPDEQSHRLQQVKDCLSKVVQRPDVRWTLAAPPEDDASAPLPSLSSFLECAEAAPDAPKSPSPRRQPSVPLIVPPAGVEDEPGLANADDDAFFSVSEESEDEHPPSNRNRASSSSSAADSGAMCFERRIAGFPIGMDDDHTWRAFDCSDFNVRSATYFKNRKKCPSGPAMLECANIDFIKVGPSGPVWRVATHSDFFPQVQRRKGDRRFFVIHNWVFPPYQAILIAALDPDAPWLADPESPQAKVWKRFLEMDPVQKKDHLKVIFSVNEGPWLVKRAAPKKPVLIGRKVKINTFHEPGDHVEFVIDIASGRAEQYAVSIVMKALRALQVSIGLLLESRQEDELPETMMWCGGVKYMDLSRFGYPEEDKNEKG
mmetsp:Transcript_59982/g.106377  ORF Transcript_59982/g.106377 Transcript_59982/m.106377 type:complete len:689 (-) Transcript_59982:184-2250(-)